MKDYRHAVQKVHGRFEMGESLASYSAHSVSNPERRRSTLNRIGSHGCRPNFATLERKVPLGQQYAVRGGTERSLTRPDCAVLLLDSDWSTGHAARTTSRRYCPVRAADCEVQLDAKPGFTHR